LPTKANRVQCQHKSWDRISDFGSEDLDSNSKRQLTLAVMLKITIFAPTLAP